MADVAVAKGHTAELPLSAEFSVELGFTLARQFGVVLSSTDKRETREIKTNTV
eukprot:m.486948 g.486948  ORF g.486948 m.486948 type:complete len:53 (+) comp24692_c0_seq1:87-245(+)